MKADIHQEELNQIQKILWRYLDNKKHKAFLFGSRVTGSAFRWSDIDVGVLGDSPVSAEKMESIKDALEESDIPHVVEVVDFSQVDGSFRKMALQNTIPIHAL